MSPTGLAGIVAHARLFSQGIKACSGVEESTQQVPLQRLELPHSVPRRCPVAVSQSGHPSHAPMLVHILTVLSTCPSSAQPLAGHTQEVGMTGARRMGADCCTQGEGQPVGRSRHPPQAPQLSPHKP